MSSLSTEDVQSALSDAPIEVTKERRAFGNRRGVPDAVIWLSPGHSAFPDRTLPVLVELEGTFGGADADFEKFAQRHNDSKYQYRLEWPAAAEELPPVFRTCKYDIAGIPARRLGSGYSVEEREMFALIADWFEDFTSTFDRTVTARQYGDTTVLYWDLEFRMYGHRFQTTVPYFVNVGNDLQSTIERYISPPTVPSAVVINDEYGPNDAKVAYHETKIEFPALRAIRFRS